MCLSPPFTQPQPRFQTTTISHQDHVIGSQRIPLDAHSFLLFAHPSQSVHQSVARGIFQKSNSIMSTYFISDFCLAPFGDTPLSLGWNLKGVNVITRSHMVWPCLLLPCYRAQHPSHSSFSLLFNPVPALTRAVIFLHPLLFFFFFS